MPCAFLTANQRGALPRPKGPKTSLLRRLQQWRVLEMAELAREDAPAAVEPSPRIVRGTGAASAPLELASSDDEAPRETKKAPTQRFFLELERDEVAAMASSRDHVASTPSSSRSHENRRATASSRAGDEEEDGRSGHSHARDRAARRGRVGALRRTRYRSLGNKQLGPL